MLHRLVARRACGPLTLIVLATAANAEQLVVQGPAGSGEFGRSVTVLPNGNFVVTDPAFDLPGAVDAGAVHLYGPDGVVLARLTGSAAGDHVGSGGIVALANGHFVAASPYWGGARGAVTWVHGGTGLSAAVSEANSLVGSRADDVVGQSGVMALPNGHYVVRSASWDNSVSGTIQSNAGAVTWGNGAGGTSGVVSPQNSLVGVTAGDQVGDADVVTLSSGDYVVRSPGFDDGALVDVGAVTWASGNEARSGTIGAANSLLGSFPGDRIGQRGVLALSNGHYVVLSPSWHNGSTTSAGAVTWANGEGGFVGRVSAVNSLVGTRENDLVGSRAVALSNGHYVVVSQVWDSGLTTDAGAVTWCNGAAGCRGEVAPANSLVGARTGDLYGSFVAALTNGHYVVGAPLWDDGSTLIDAGAALWRNGSIATSGTLGSAGALAGSTAGDEVGTAVHALANGDYVVASPNWDDVTRVDVGAATWRSGSDAVSARVSAANSLTGASAGDRLPGSVLTLGGASYVVSTPLWDAGAGLADVGAVTFCQDGASCQAKGSPGVANSLTGSAAADRVGRGLHALGGNRYLVSSPEWDNALFAVPDAGAVTWVEAGAPVGPVLPANSLVGASVNDQVGNQPLQVLANGDYFLRVFQADNAGLVDAGAVSYAFGDGSTRGPINASNSVLGQIAGGGGELVGGGDGVRRQIVVGQPNQNLVTILRPGAPTSSTLLLVSPSPAEVGQEVGFIVRVASSMTAPIGTMRVTASTGERCEDSTSMPSDSSDTGVSYVCTVAFGTSGMRSVRAEFLGTSTHAYSSAAPTSVQVGLFGDGFE